MISLVAKVTVRGRHHLPKKGPFIIAINHFNLVDPPFVVYAVRRPINFLAASDQVVDWYNYWAIWLYGFIPTNRTQLGPSTIKTAKRVLKEKDILGIFPEGSSLSNELRPAKDGVVYLSATMRVPIVPVSVMGLSKNIWENILKGVRPKVRVNIGKSFGPYSLPKDRSKKASALKKIGHKVMCRIAALLPDECHGAYWGDPSIEIYRNKNRL
ncbi:MAG: 1-acyl-sn-glycerol-3-phosphate acyltransferase [Candidatus Marinimicrobia bacterium]|nr:1-acyl-sn-glycerol-3-phosphate acyltransferase [Candidatus Neomarinimicrobiota bacterium]MBL7031218.1 1-acyl-sn-glycerol-3-phosphate acyltransferase [Candidatus Neomarinimicrobiota bacterium]